ncbi:MAG: peptidoglycan-binding domain-containing protein [Gaiellaceae bacterium]
MDPEDRRGRGEEDWLGDEQWLESPTEERLPTQQPRRGTWQRRPVGAWNRDRVVTAVILTVALVVIIVVITATALGDGDGGEVAEPEDSPATTQVQTPTVDEPPALPERGQLDLNDRGRRVRGLQRALNDLGYRAGQPDGVYGSQTVAAVRRFQREAGLPDDGIAGPSTLRALNQALAERS